MLNFVSYLAQAWNGPKYSDATTQTTEAFKVIQLKIEDKFFGTQSRYHRCVVVNVVLSGQTSHLE